MFKSSTNYLPEHELLINKHLEPNTERLLSHYELYKLVKNLNGSIVKCGINNDESFRYFSFFKKINSYNPNQSLIAFEKSTPILETTIVDKEERLSVKNKEELAQTQKSLYQQSKEENIEFISGELSTSLPKYLIDNPELKISLLVVDLDNYDHTITTMQYLYPRIINKGVLIINNYYKKEAENKAIQDYFNNQNVIIRYFSKANGVYYIIKD
ncbi:MAG: TylF/MycF family methyltransferase [Chitinophagales bacterium]|nr:TylF/MycF family methyltransferase [Chitinophagales bacterium]